MPVIRFTRAASGRIPAAPGQPEPVPVIRFTRAASGRSAAVPGQPRASTGDLLHQSGQRPERCCSWTTRAGAGDLRPAAGYLLHLDNPSQYR
ncbi:hypothetical protein O23A_P3p0048 (plasmid) [Aeromonas salmonicida]|nr:hypothetical protein O23A_P3p0048 [Aeromonas salmonicida]